MVKRAASSKPQMSVKQRGSAASKGLQKRKTNGAAMGSAAKSASLAQRIKWVDSIASGLSFDQVQALLYEFNVAEKDLLNYNIVAPRTWSHCKNKGMFSAEQSDRIARFLRVWQQTTETFGSGIKSRRWLERETRALLGKKPVDLLSTETGARIVEELLQRIDHGLAA